jgi:hypothetical protein
MPNFCANLRDLSTVQTHAEVEKSRRVPSQAHPRSGLPRCKRRSPSHRRRQTARPSQACRRPGFCAAVAAAAHSAPSKPANVFFAGGGRASAQTSGSGADRLITACAAIKAAYDGSAIHSAQAIAKRCVPDPVRRNAYGASHTNAEAGWSYAFDDETPESFISRCPPSQGGGVWISMTHRPHWTAGERYYSTRPQSRIDDSDECMAAISRDWAACTDKNQISLVKILGERGFGCGKVRV